jgi:tryptophan-rich sensory protein
MKNATYYSQHLRRPAWAPPAWLFAPVWSALYLLIAISFGAVFVKGFQGQLSFAIVVPFLLNLVFNMLYTPIQFGLKNNYLAALDIALVLGTLFWMLIAIYPFLPWVAYANIPYMLWVLFATVLQFTITWINR